MSDFGYSNEALNSISKFHQVNNILYVEGDDDELFWEEVLNFYDVKSTKTISLGSSTEVDKYINNLINNEGLEFFVARDLDYLLFNNKHIKHNKVLYTYGYSIENTLINKKGVINAISSYGRIKKSDINSTDSFDNWVYKILTALEELIIFDIINDITCKENVQHNGIQILGDNCIRFMVDKISNDFCINKINNFIQEKKLVGIYGHRKDEVNKSIIDMNKNFFQIIRGHFLFSATLKYISSVISKYNSSKNKISNDALFSILIVNLSDILKSNPIEYEHYKNESLKLKNN